VVVGGGGVEAPRQPIGQSSSTYTRGARRPGAQNAGPAGKIFAPVRSLVGVRGMEDNHVWGIGLVDGLAGTGDSGDMAKQLLRNILLTQNIVVAESDLESDNLAVVRVEATIPAGMRPGQLVDVRVSAIGDATSLVGGNLAFAELFEPSGELVFATASGPLTVGGFSVGGAAASTTKNHTTVGTLPMGGKIEREVPTNIVSEHGFIHLDSRKGQDTFGNVVRIADAINGLFPDAAAVQPDGKCVKVRVPSDLPERFHVEYLNRLLSLEVETDNLARVVINERTGVIVMGGDVRLRPGAIAHGAIIVEIAETAEVSQPGPASAGQTETVDRTELDVQEENNPLVLVPEAVTLQEVVEVLNTLGASPRDLISILTALSETGMLVAEIRRM
jgi:flagellar P-ring protein precursor FlgI